MWTGHIIKIYTSLLYIWLNLYKLAEDESLYKKCGMRNVKGKKIYTSQDKSDWNLYKVSVWMGRNLYKPVQIRGLYKKKELYGMVV
jgi:hypothetical protein